MIIRLTGEFWRKELNVNPIRARAFRVDVLGNVYVECSMGEGLSIRWCWRTVSNPALIDFVKNYGVGDHRTAIVEWS